MLCTIIKIPGMCLMYLLYKLAVMVYGCLHLHGQVPRYLANWYKHDLYVRIACTGP